MCNLSSIKISSMGLPVASSILFHTLMKVVCFCFFKYFLISELLSIILSFIFHLDGDGFKEMNTIGTFGICCLMSVYNFLNRSKTILADTVSDDATSFSPQ